MPTPILSKAEAQEPAKKFLDAYGMAVVMAGVGGIMGFFFLDGKHAYKNVLLLAAIMGGSMLAVNKMFDTIGKIQRK